MKAYIMPPGCKSVDDLKQVERPDPKAGLGQVVVGVRAASLNYRDLFEQMNAAINANGIKPVIDKVFPFDQAKEAFGHAASGDFIGKVVIAI
jgi:NADPH:quinone reductase-like Zn-dependent oxidoreductase